MWFKNMPEKGDRLKMVFSGVLRGSGGISTVLKVFPYTGRYPELFTHVMRYTALSTSRGWMEITINVEEARRAKP